MVTNQTNANVENLLSQFGLQNINIFEIIKQVNPDLKTYKEFLEIAKRDLKASKLLYQKKDYANSVYHIQQAVEKANKAYGLKEGTITRQDLTKISHNSPYALVLPFETTLFSLATQIDSKAMEKISKAKETMKDQSKRLEIAKMKKQEIQAILKQIKTINKNLEKIWPLIKSLLATSIDEKGAKRALLSMEITGELMQLGIITFPHESSTRYPTEDLSPKDYTKTLGIVQSLPNIWKQLEKTIKKIESEPNLVKKEQQFETTN